MHLATPVLLDMGHKFYAALVLPVYVIRDNRHATVSEQKAVLASNSVSWLKMISTGHIVCTIISYRMYNYVVS